MEVNVGDVIKYMGTPFTLTEDIGNGRWKAMGKGLVWTFKPEHIAKAKKTSSILHMNRRKKQ